MLFRLLAGSLKCIIRPLTVVINNHTWGNADADADAATTMTPVIDINASSELPINDRDCQFIYVSEGSLRFGVTCVGPYVAFSVLGFPTIVTAEKATAQIDHTTSDLREQTETGID